MAKTNDKKSMRRRRHKRIRAKVIGTADRPRLSIFKSNKHIYAQLIDDTKGKTLASSSSRQTDEKKSKDSPVLLGKDIAKKTKELKISKVVFDRAGFAYAGRIKAVADSARKEGLNF